MDDVGFGGGDEVFDCVVGGEVVVGVGAADEVGGDEDFVAGGLGAFHEGAFGAGAGAGEEGDVVAFGVEAFTGEEGVFLGAADDEAGDDVEDFHGWGTGYWDAGVEGAFYRKGCRPDIGKGIGVLCPRYS